MSTQEELEARIAAAKARQAAIADAQSTAAIAAAQAVEAKDQAYSLLDNTLQADKANTFTAAQTFHAPVTVGTPRVAAVWAFKEIGISDVNMRKAGTISDNDGHTLDILEDATRTQNQFVALVEASSLGLKVTYIGTTYRFYDVQSPDDQAGTLGNARRLYVNGLGWSSQQTWSLAGGKDGVAEVGHPMMLNGNVYIGHGPEGVKARCYFDVNTAYMTKAGTLTDNNLNHPLVIELPEDPARTIDSCIVEINAQGEKLEVKAIKRNGSSIYLESTVEGSVPNGIVFTRTGCLSTNSAGTAQTTTQGTNIQGLDEGAASEFELRQNGYPVASRQTNNVYEGVQVFNNTVALNGPIQGSGEVGGSLLSADEAVAFGIGKGFFEQDSRTAPSTAYVLYGPRNDSQPALLSIPTVPASSEDRTKVYRGTIPPRYILLRGYWPTNAFGELTRTGQWYWTTAKEVDEVHIYWPGQTTSSRFFNNLHCRRLVLDLPNLSRLNAVGCLSGSTAAEIIANTPALTNCTQSDSGLIHFQNGFAHDVSIDWTATALTTFNGHVYPATYRHAASVVGCRLKFQALSNAPNLFQWGGTFSTVSQADWYYTLSNLPDWTEDTASAYRAAIAAYNADHSDTTIDVQEGAALAELYEAVMEHNTQYPDSKCTVTQPHNIGLAAVENCYAAVAQWLDDGGIPYTREPGHAPAAVLPYGWSITYLS